MWDVGECECDGRIILSISVSINLMKFIIMRAVCLNIEIVVSKQNRIGFNRVL